MSSRPVHLFEPVATAEAAPIWTALRQVRLRLRLQAAMAGGLIGLCVGAAFVLAALLLWHLGWLPLRGVRAAVWGAAGLGVLWALLGALRRIHPLVVATRIDQSHALRDRIASALQFMTPAAPAGTEEATAQALRRLAVADAARHAGQVLPSRAAPWRRPAPLLPLLALLLLDVGLALWRLPRPRLQPPPPPPPSAPQLPRLIVDPELLAPEKEELLRLAAAAKEDPEAAAILAEMQRLLEQVERGELARQDAFDKLAELEQRLMQGHEGVLEALRERLRKAGSELGEAKLSKELGQALVKEDLDKARRELSRLAAQAQQGALGDKERQERQQLAQALERAAGQKSEPRAARDEKNQPKEQWQERTRSEELTQKMQQLQEEERRLKKQVEKNPSDEESVRRLNKVKRDLERLEREKQERDSARRELERLERDLQRAAEQMRQQLDRMTPEQRQALEQLAKDMSRMQDEIRKLQRQGQGRGQMMVALGSIKQVLRRVARSGQGQSGQGGQGSGQGNDKGQGQGQGNSPMKDFMSRAGGKGKGQGDEVLVEGEGGKGEKMMILGEGNDPVLLPGLPGGQGPDQHSGGPQPGDGIGKEHDPNFLGNATQIDARRRLTRVIGKEGAGPTRSETILGAAERGFASQPYRKVYQDYTAVSEQAMSKERVPPGYRFYVKRYFQMIKPRE